MSSRRSLLEKTQSNVCGLTPSDFLPCPDITVLSRREVGVGVEPGVCGGRRPAAAAAGGRRTGQTEGRGPSSDRPAARSPLHDQCRSGELPAGRTPLPAQVSPASMKHSDKLQIRNRVAKTVKHSWLQRCCKANKMNKLTY